MSKERYKVLIIPSGQRDLDNIKDKKLLTKIKNLLLSLRSEPRPRGSIKLLDKEGGHRVRIGNFRCCYRIDDTSKIIFIYRVKHRKEVYR